MSDRRKERELQEARQSGTVPPQVDVKTGAMINPHNPEFITKRPWYLGNSQGADSGPSLDHQTSQRPNKDRLELSLSTAHQLVQQQRQQWKQQQVEGKFEVGMWVEALKNNKGPYRICKILKMAHHGTVFDLQYEDGTVERKVKLSKHSSKPRIQMTKTGARSLQLDAATHGKETFDSKRDKYHGYDQESHTQRVSRIYEERDELRKQQREAQKKEKVEEDDDDDNGDTKGKKAKADRDSDSDSDLDSDVGSDSDDEFVQRDEDAKVITSRLARQGGVGGAQMKVTARNLRIREDTAKYLRNLDVNSAYYDPKSRSMRDNPNPDMAPEEAQFAGDNFTRISGDAVQLAETQLFAWDATEKGLEEIHPQANPSQAELLKKKFKSKSADLKLQKKKAVLDKYGGAEYLDGSGGLATAVDRQNQNELEAKEAAALERKIRFGVKTVAEEYTPDGRLVKGPVRPKQVALKSKYEEDVFINGHTTVWGSYFHVGAFISGENPWGYADDHSLIRNSYCTGVNGRVANDEANEMRFGTGVAGSAALAQARGMLKVKTNSTSNSTFQERNKSKLYGEADPSLEIDEGKLKEALKKMEKEKSKPLDERKRKYNSMNAEVDVTAEEMEAYRLQKDRGSDPMANIGSDKLIDYK